MKKLLSIVLAVTMLLSLAACGGSSAPAATEAPAESNSEPVSATAAPPAEPTAEPEPEPAVVVTDMMGREIKLMEPATRVVAVSAAVCEILYAVGAGDTLVGRGTYCDYPAEVLDVPAVESGYDLNVEQILALEPQVVLMSTMAQSQEQIDALEAAGIQVVVSDAQDIAGVYTSIEMIGKLMGKEAEAAKVVEDMKATFADLAAKATGDGSKSIYVEVSELQWGLWAAGKGTFYQEVIEMLGLKNTFEDVDLYAEVSEEQVLERNPDYILTITMYFGEGPTPVEEIMGRKGWENVTAVKNAAILNLPNNELSRPAPRLAEGAQMLFDFIYGEAAQDNAA